MEELYKILSDNILTILPPICGITIYLVYMAFFSEKMMIRHEIRQRIKQIEKVSIDDLYRGRKRKAGALDGLYSIIEPYVNKLQSTYNQRLSEDNIKKMGEELYLANIDIPPENFIFYRYVGIAVLGIIGSTISLLLFSNDSTNMMLIMLMSWIAPYIILRFYIGTRKTNRINIIKSDLPNVLDLLSIAVDAGMGFDQAVEYICSEMDGPLIDEFKVVCREEGLGKTRNEALQSMANRLQIPMVTSFATAVIQSTELGVSMREVLASQAEEIRTAHVTEVKEKASKAVIKILIPIVMFIFPTIFLILMGPSVLKIQGLGI